MVCCRAEQLGSLRLAYELWEAFGTWRFWLLQPKIRDAIIHSNLRSALGLNGVRASQQPARIMSSIDWNHAQRDQRSWLSVFADWSVGCMGDVGDYLFVNLNEWQLMLVFEAKR